ncbi:MAG: hypothetical protein DMG58_23845 [Acidobacteria bacterium]|nr:MAG: hypothetical protein DMG58_23845 [Acidobacteriota bacterium]
MAKRIPPEVLAYLRKWGQAYGSQGGKKAAKNMMPAERKAREEGIDGGSRAAYGQTVGQRRHQTREEGREKEVTGVRGNGVWRPLFDACWLGGCFFHSTRKAFFVQLTLAVKSQ